MALSSCSDDDAEFPALDPGTYYLEIFNDQGQKVLTRSGEAIGLGDYSQISLTDPQFITQSEGDPLNTFAYLFLTTGNEYDVWNQKQIWPVNSPSQAMLNQRYYNIGGDWAYENVSGKVVITESTATILKGHFTMKMMALEPGSKWGMAWSVNPKWGDHIVVKGYFVSRGW